MDKDNSFDEYLAKVNIQEVLKEAGYRLNRKDGIRYPSYSNYDGSGQRISGDKFLITANGQCCFQPPMDRRYNVISFITEHPEKFRQYTPGMNRYALVHKVCQDILNIPEVDRRGTVVNPVSEHKPFNMEDTTLTDFDISKKESYVKFYPFFAPRAISLSTQAAFARSFKLSSRKGRDGGELTNLAFPMYKPGDAGREIVGLELRGRRKADGTSYKGMAPGSNSSEGLWVASPSKTDLSATRDVYWFESAYDAMAYYQLHRKTQEATKGVYVSTGGCPTVAQMRGVLDNAPDAVHHICFDNDLAGQQFAHNLRQAAGKENDAATTLNTADILARPDLIPYLNSLKSRDSFTDKLRDIFTSKGRKGEYAYVMSGDESLLPDDFRNMDKAELREALVDYYDLYQGSREYLASISSTSPRVEIGGTEYQLGQLELLPAPLCDIWNETALNNPTQYSQEEIKSHPEKWKEREAVAVKEWQRLQFILEAWTGTPEQVPSVSFIREIPDDGSKDWNEQLIRQQDRLAKVGKTESQAVSATPAAVAEEQESDKAHYHR